MERLLQFDPILRQAIEGRIRQIDAFRDNWEITEALSAEVLRTLQQLATVQSTGSSTRIEGAKLADTEVAELMRSMQVRKLSSRDEQEVAGYFQTLQLIQENHPYIDLSENTIRGLHKQLLQYSDKDAHHLGNYKTLSNQVVATLPSGKQRIIFQTTEPAAVNEAMRQLLTWTITAFAEKTQHPLVVVGTFVYELLTIHPFQDGNGRLSRLLTNLLLLQQGYTFVQYASLEREVERDKARYYESLMQAQRQRGTEQEVIGRWMNFFLDMLLRIIDTLREKQREVNEPAALYLNQRQRTVLEYIRKQGFTALKDVETQLPEVSRNTLKYDLKRLHEAGYLTRQGKGRGTVYAVAIT